MGLAGTCKKCVLVIPQWFYQALYFLFVVAGIGGGGFLCYYGFTFMTSSAGYFMGKEVPYGALAMGGVAAFLAVFGAIAPTGACRGDKKSMLQLFYVLCIPVVIVLLVFCAICMVNATDKENVKNMLDYGWFHASQDQTKGSSAIQRAETDNKCCGFLNPSDRAVQPCSGSAGCVAPMEKAIKAQLMFGGMLFGGVAGALFLLMGVTHAWVEHLRAEEAKNVPEGADKFAMSGKLLDIVRPASADGTTGMNANARLPAAKAQAPKAPAAGEDPKKQS